MILKIKKLIETAEVPQYNTATDAGMDLTAVSKTTGDNYVEYGTGLAMEIPDGYVGLIFPRSSVSKYDQLLCNSVGVIDSGYRGEVKLRFKKTKDEDAKLYEVGERVGQLMVMPYPKVEVVEVEELASSERGEGGFGSSGK